MYFLAQLLSFAVNMYIGVIILQVILNWLIIFEVIRTGNEQARNLMALLSRLTDPVYKPLRKYVPPIGGIDITPLVVILGLNIMLSFVFRFLIF